MIKQISSLDLVHVLSTVTQKMQASRDKLIELDSIIGDGDLGITMEKGFVSALKAAKENQNSNPGSLFMKVGMAFVKNAPSTMGTLMGTGFIRGGKALGENFHIDVNLSKEFLGAFTKGIQERGKAKLGEKTILDVLFPAYESMSKYTGDDVLTAWEQALQGAEYGVEATKEMISQHGKAAVFQQKTKGIEDPGSMAVLILFKGFYEGLADIS